MTSTFCTSGAVKLRAGVNRPTDDTVLTISDYDTYINQAEQHINMEAKSDLIDDFGNLDANIKEILELAASSHAAMSVISHDPSGYNSLAEAQTLLDVNAYFFEKAMRLIKEKQYTVDTMGATS